MAKETSFQRASGALVAASTPPVQHRNRDAAPANGQQQQHLTRSAKNKKLFPQKLWDLINDEKYNFCLRWSDDGQLVYLNRDAFEDSYLKTPENQFHTQKAISFVRQMNMYGFRKVDDCYYENDNFKRNCDHLLKSMIRKHPSKGQPISCHRQVGDKTNCSDLLPLTSPQQSAYNAEHHEELILHQQENNTQFPTDLTMTQESRHLNIPTTENNNLNALYILLASINSNLNQPLSNQYTPDNRATPFDINKFAELQQVYQHIFEQLLYKGSLQS